MSELQKRAEQELDGRIYEVQREGHTGSFELSFHKNGKLLFRQNGQVIEESWQYLGGASVRLGGLSMPAAHVVLGPRGVGGDANELWEPSPPDGAAPLLGKLKPNVDFSTHLATKLELIVDKSGSMQPLLEATVQGLNSFLNEQRTLPRAMQMTMRLVVFSDRIETPWPEGTPLCDATCTVTPQMVKPSGSTALLDAIASTLYGTPLQPPRVVCIVTDGHENSSTRYTRSQANAMIAERRNVGWTFIFLAANQDAIAEGATLGIAAGNCASFAATPAGIEGGFGSASAASNRGCMFGSGAAVFTTAERKACFSLPTK